jgi:hypothetical protein
MPSPKQVKVATEMLREYRDYLRDCDNKLQDIKNGVERGRLPVGTWGVLLEGIVQPGPVPPGEPRKYAQPVIGGTVPAGDAEFLDVFGAAGVGHVPSPLVVFKQTYEAGHEAAMKRLDDLKAAYAETALALHKIAEHYDANEERGQQHLRQAADER